MQKQVVSLQCEWCGQHQSLRRDVVLGRYHVASITCSDGHIAIAVGREGGLGYTRLINKGEGSIYSNHAPWKTAVAASARVARRPNILNEKGVFEDATIRMRMRFSSAKCDGFYTFFTVSEEFRGK